MQILKINRINRRETARKLLKTEIEKLTPQERVIVKRFISRGRVARDVMRELDEQLTFGERLADRVASFGGSWAFILIFTAFLIVWMIFNTLVLGSQAFDPYPYNPAQPRFVVPRRAASARNYDEPESRGRDRPHACEERLRGERQGRVGNPPASRKDQRVARERLEDPH